VGIKGSGGLKGFKTINALIAEKVDAPASHQALHLS
jgi:hypothetical protein